MTRPTSAKAAKRTREPVPWEYAGKLIAWSEDGLRIVAVGETYEEVMAAAAQAGVEKPILEGVPPANYLGFGVWESDFPVAPDARSR